MPSPQAPAAGFTGVDLQVATAEQIAALGILDGETSRRLADYGPLPQDLHTIATPAVPGLSDPLIDRLLASGRVAITPQPFSYEGTTWRWAGRDHGTIVEAFEDPRYALYVPPGLVASDGAWATASVAPDVYGQLPAVDGHIYGDWTGEVGVRLPAVVGQDAASSYVMHDSADGPKLSTYSAGIADGPNGTVVSALTSLSTSFTAPRPTLDTSTGGTVNDCLATYPGSSLWCRSAVESSNVITRDVSVEQLAAQMRLKAAQSPPVHPGPCPSTGSPLIFVSGSMWDMSCKAATLGADGSGKTATFTWVNDPGPIFGNAYAYRSQGNAEVWVERSDKHGIFTTGALNEMARRNEVILSGDTMKVTISQGGGEVRTSTLTGSHPEGYWGLAQVTNALDLASSIDPRLNFTGGWLDCVNGLDQLSAQTAISCATSVGESTIDSYLAIHPEKTALTGKLAGIRAALERVGAALLIFDEVASASKWFSQISNDWVTYEYQNPRPVVGPGSSPMGGGYIALTPTRQSFFVDIAQGKAWEIETPGDWNCYATGYYAYESTIELAIGGDHLTSYGDPVIQPGWAPSCTSLPRTWNYKSVHDGGNIADGVLVKQPDWLIRWAGYVNGDGQLQWDSNGAAYVCLSEKDTPIILNFPQSAIDAWWGRPGGKGEDLSTCPI